jgi:hypothetical protein
MTAQFANFDIAVIAKQSAGGSVFAIHDQLMAMIDRECDGRRHIVGEARLFIDDELPPRIAEEQLVQHGAFAIQVPVPDRELKLTRSQVVDIGRVDFQTHEGPEFDALIHPGLAGRAARLHRDGDGGSFEFNEALVLIESPEGPVGTGNDRYGHDDLLVRLTMGTFGPAATSQSKTNAGLRRQV